MELYTNSADRTIYLDVPVLANEESLEVAVYDGDDLVFEVPAVTYDEGRYSFTLPFAFVQYDRRLEVRWVFEYVESEQTYEYSQSTDVEIVTPILSADEIKTILDDAETGYTASDEEIVSIEKAVRFIIQAHTGQSFGKFIGKRSVTGNGDDYLRLPQRLISLNSVNGETDWETRLVLRGGGWFLRPTFLAYPPPVRADFFGWNEATASAVPIAAPYSKSTYSFARNIEYSLDGVWGWSSVPMGVKEAAKLLVNDYACGDINYRDRFLTSMTAADWRIQFHDGAFASTGNVRANQLLSEYVLRRGWSVI